MAREYRSPVIFCGENPGLALYGSNGEIVANASYWRCTYSPHGEGNLLVLWLDRAGAGLGDGATTAIYTDNAAMARFVVDTLNQHFGGFSDKGLTAITPQPARFFQDSDSRWYHRVTCNTGDEVIELVWADIRDRQLMWGTEVEYGGKKFDLATVMCPCGEGKLMVNDRAAQGAPRVSERDGPPQSSAFLAFAESWVAKD